ncbi:MAG: DUF1223 domain-containing protein [Planktomarina sp.]
MRKLICAAAVTVSAFFSSSANAEDRPVVVELFTSQGCSSCPPADAYLHELAKRSDVVALALHVDYWDYIGWKDSFADPAYTARQRSYARVQSERVVYTPQLMINGVEHVVGNRRNEVANAVNKHAQSASVVSVDAYRRAGEVVVTLSKTNRPGNFDVHLVTVVRNSAVEILRGENAGKTITYANVVRDWRTIGNWNGQSGIKLSGPMASTGQQVVVVQRHGQGEIISAAWVK